MPSDDHERRGECRDDFKRLNDEITDIRKPGGSISKVHDKVDTIKACLQKEINMKIGMRIFMWIVGGLAGSVFTFLIILSSYTYGIDKATAGHVTKQELKEEVGESKEYFKEEIDELQEDIDNLTIQNAKDKQEILDAIKNSR